MTPHAPVKGMSSPVRSDEEEAKVLGFPTTSGKSLTDTSLPDKSRRPNSPELDCLWRGGGTMTKSSPYWGWVLPPDAPAGGNPKGPGNAAVPVLMLLDIGKTGKAWDGEGFLGLSPGLAVPPGR
ncbi:proline-rich protein 12-like [Grus japonensis]|uniref:Proline-rich protein 12-like n=1 Tax=Grus japonensis TaxID=30415 RepID=A0ABC9X0Q7_GRUJA